MPDRIYDVPDISCAHCQAAIEEAVSAVPGVSAVSVDVDARTTTVAGTAEVGPVTAAIGEAGYEVATVREQAEAG